MRKEKTKNEKFIVDREKELIFLKEKYSNIKVYPSQHGVNNVIEIVHPFDYGSFPEFSIKFVIRIPQICYEDSQDESCVPQISASFIGLQFNKKTVSKIEFQVEKVIEYDTELHGKRLLIHDVIQNILRAVDIFMHTKLKNIPKLLVVDKNVKKNEVSLENLKKYSHSESEKVMNVFLDDFVWITKQYSWRSEYTRKGLNEPFLVHCSDGNKRFFIFNDSNLFIYNIGM